MTYKEVYNQKALKKKALEMTTSFDFTQAGFFHGVLPRTPYRGMFYGTSELCVEASSVGFKPFSAFYATLDGKNIEMLYQDDKIIGGQRIGNLCLPDKERLQIAKSGTPDDPASSAAYYSSLWDAYIEENAYLKDVLRRVTGIGAIFGRPHPCCQSTELWRIRAELLGIPVTPRVIMEEERLKEAQQSLF
mgnify:FL=1